MYASDPSCVTLNSTISNLLFVASVIDTKYLALLTVEVLKVFITVVVDVATVVVAAAAAPALAATARRAEEFLAVRSEDGGLMTVGAPLCVVVVRVRIDADHRRGVVDQVGVFANVVHL